MVWASRSVLDERLRFVAEHGGGEWSLSELAEAYGISRKTGYKWLKRYAAEGAPGLLDRSRAPHCHGRATDGALAEAIIAEKLAHPHWGPKKLRARLRARRPEAAWPSASTMGEILKREGLVAARRMKRRGPASGPLSQPLAPNALWSADHKGWFRLRDAARCEPLTVLDAFSRMWLALEATGSVSHDEAQPVFDRLFREHGLPDAIRTDNGAPFVAPGTTGLTRLSAWWIELGIAHERIAPGRPQQNGRHERAHATMIPLQRAPEANLARQQRAFDAFRREYNEERPHEALGQIAPARVYRPSRRPMPRRIAEPDYPAEAAVRRVRLNGSIKWKGGEVFLTEALAGKLVAVEEDDRARAWSVRFHTRRLGLIDQQRLRRITSKNDAAHTPQNSTKCNLSIRSEV